MKNAIIKKVVLIALIAVIVASFTFGLCACNKNETPYSHFNENVRFKVDTTKTNVMDMDLGPTLVTAIFKLAIDKDNTYAEFKTDGTMHFQLQTAAGLLGEKLDSLLNTLASPPLNMSIDIEGMLSEMDLTGMLNDYVEPMFPGFTAKLEDGDLGGALNLAATSLGLNIVGLDYSNQAITDLVREIGTTKRIPANLLEIIPSDTVLTLTWDCPYYIWNKTAHDGSTYTAIEMGDLGKTDTTQPWCVFDMTTNSKGERELFFRAEFMMSYLTLVEQTL